MWKDGIQAPRFRPDPAGHRSRWEVTVVPSYSPSSAPLKKTIVCEGGKGNAGYLWLYAVAPHTEVRGMASVTALPVIFGVRAMVGPPQDLVGLRFFLVALHTPVGSPVMALVAVHGLGCLAMHLEPVCLLVIIRYGELGVAHR